VRLERGPLSLVSATEELLGRKSSGSGLENREYGRRGSVAPTTLHPLSAKVGTNLQWGNCGKVGLGTLGSACGCVRRRGSQMRLRLSALSACWYTEPPLEAVSTSGP
jgi:hypothetical protein